MARIGEIGSGWRRNVLVAGMKWKMMIGLKVEWLDARMGCGWYLSWGFHSGLKEGIRFWWEWNESFDGCGCGVFYEWDLGFWIWKEIWRRRRRLGVSDWGFHRYGCGVLRWDLGFWNWGFKVWFGVLKETWKRRMRRRGRRKKKIKTSPTRSWPSPNWINEKSPPCCLHYVASICQTTQICRNWSGFAVNILGSLVVWPVLMFVWSTLQLYSNLLEFQRLACCANC